MSYVEISAELQGLNTSDIRASADVACLGFPRIETNPLLELTGKLVDLAWPVGGIVCHARELLRVWSIFWACVEQGGVGWIACRNELDVVGGEGEVHSAAARGFRESAGGVLEDKREWRSSAKYSSFTKGGRRTYGSRQPARAA